MGGSLQLRVVPVNVPFEPRAVYGNSGVSRAPAAVSTKMLTKGCAGSHPRAAGSLLVMWNGLL